MFLKLVDDVRAHFAARGFTEVSVDEGLEARNAQSNFGAGSANRVVFVPSAQPMSFEAPRYIGEDDSGRRQLWNVTFVYEVSFAGFDADHPERDLAHRRKCFDLLEVTVQAVHLAYWGACAWTSARWEDTRKHGRHGAELIATLTLNIPIFDVQSALAFPAPKALPDPDYAAGLPLTQWLRDFSAVPWAGSASLGISGAGDADLVTAGADPTAGTLNGHGTADFDGTKSLVAEGTLERYLNPKAFSGWMLVYLEAGPDGGDLWGGVEHGALLSHWLGDFTLTLYDGVSVTAFAIVAVSRGAWTLLTWRYDGERVQVGVNEVPGSSGGDSSVAFTGDITPRTSAVSVGSGIGAAVNLAGRIAEIGISDQVLSNEQFTNVIASVRARYDVPLA